MELSQLISTEHMPVIAKHSPSGAESLSAQLSLQPGKMPFHLLTLGFQYCFIQFLFLCASITSPHLLPLSPLFTVPLV